MKTIQAIKTEMQILRLHLGDSMKLETAYKVEVRKAQQTLQAQEEISASLRASYQLLDRELSMMDGRFEPPEPTKPKRKQSSMTATKRLISGLTEHEKAELIKILGG